MKRILLMALPAVLALGVAACDRPDTGTTATNRSDTTTTDKSPNRVPGAPGSIPSGSTPPGTNPTPPPSGTSPSK